MRIAIIADTHGNLFSLDAVLAEIDAEGIARIVCLGDIAGLGPHPPEKLARLRALACPVVMGNADEFLLDPVLLDPTRHPDADEKLCRLHDMECWAAAQLGAEDCAYIRTFRPLVEVALGDGASLLCYHGSPRSAWDEIRAATPDDDLAALLGDRNALVMAGGHTHEQFVRRLNETVILNPGSVGLPYVTLRGGWRRGRSMRCSRLGVVGCPSSCGVCRWTRARSGGRSSIRACPTPRDGRRGIGDRCPTIPGQWQAGTPNDDALSAGGTRLVQATQPEASGFSTQQAKRAAGRVSFSYSERRRMMSCPYCAATVTTALSRRTTLGYRMFRSRACRRTSNGRMNTPYNHLPRTHRCGRAGRAVALAV